MHLNLDDKHPTEMDLWDTSNTPIEGSPLSYLTVLPTDESALSVFNG
jgi:hypothetical protein